MSGLDLVFMGQSYSLNHAAQSGKLGSSGFAERADSNGSCLIPNQVMLPFQGLMRSLAQNGCILEPGESRRAFWL